MQDFRNLDVWAKAHSLALDVHRETQALPKDETFGLKLQLRRSAIAIPTRIAEGCGRDSNVEFAVDLRKAKASSSELEYATLLCRDLELWNVATAERVSALTIEVRKMIHGLLRSI